MVGNELNQRRQHRRPSRIAIGSCNNQNLTQPLWDVITQRYPTAFVWAGDAIYADHYYGKNWSSFPPTEVRSPATPTRLQAYYSHQASNPSYKSFLEATNVTLIGTVDDHDMGANNADIEYTFKRESGMAFLEFIGENKGETDPSTTLSSAMYERASKGYGVYGVKLFDFDRDEGSQVVSEIDAGIDPDVIGYSDPPPFPSKYSKKSVAIFVLDVRTNKTPFKRGFESWKPDYEGDFLGERQWKWFETALRNSRASVNLIVNGLQVHPYRHPSANGAEGWGHFPMSRQRLYDTILRESTNINHGAPILISGDVHMAQLMRKDCVERSDVEGMNGKDISTTKVTRPLVELTTSGMTHSWGTIFMSSQKYHDSKWAYFYMNIFSRTIMNTAHAFFPMPDLMISQTVENKKKLHLSEDDEEHASFLYENGGGEGSKTGKQFALDLNFGEFEFDWDQSTVSARVFGKDIDAPPLLSARWSFNQLKGLKEMPGSTTTLELSEKWGGLQVDGKLSDDGDYICMNHRAPANRVQLTLAYTLMHGLASCFVFGPTLFVLWILQRRWKAME